MKNIVITLSVFFTSFIIAQEVHEVPENRDVQMMGGIGLTGGYGYMDVSRLQVFVPENISKFSSNHITMGANGFAIRNKCIYGISGSGIIGDLIKSDSINVSLKGGVGTFDFGYLILNKKNIKIYPMIGIGGSAYGLQIERNKDVSVSKISDNPGQEIKISKGGFVADLSLNLNFTPSSSFEGKNNYGGFMTGIKLGYVYSIPSSDWKFSGGDITGGPDFGLNMFYVKLIIGVFGYSNKM